MRSVRVRKQPLEHRAVLRQHVEARDQRGGWPRRDYARLMEPVKRLIILRTIVTGRERFGPRRPGLRPKSQADRAAREREQKIAPTCLKPAPASVGF